MKRTNIYILIDPRYDSVRYVGKTVQKLKYRLVQHLSERSNCKRKTWIKSLTNLNLKPIIEEIDFCDWKDSSDLEKYWISQFKTWGFKLTNMTEGGDGALGVPFTETQRKKLSATQKARYKNGAVHPMLGKTQSQKCKDAVSKAHKGIKRSKEERLKQSKTIKSKRWKPSKYMMDKMKETHQRKVKQFDLEGTLIQTFNSIKEASIQTSLFSANISTCCRGRLKTTGGYKWKYA